MPPLESHSLRAKAGLGDPLSSASFSDFPHDVVDALHHIESGFFPLHPGARSRIFTPFAAYLSFTHFLRDFIFRARPLTRMKWNSLSPMDDGRKKSVPDRRFFPSNLSFFKGPLFSSPISQAGARVYMARSFSPTGPKPVKQ